MKVCKPLKVPVLARVVTRARRDELHLTAVVAFPLDRPRALVDEFTFWQTVAGELGASAFDEGVAKARGELLVVGSCFASNGTATPSSYVRAKCGAVDKKLLVFGDRRLVRGKTSDPRPFTEMPIDWAHTYGGSSDPRNLYGKGAEEIELDGQPVRLLPNVEPLEPRANALATPASFAPMDMSFAARRARAGTFDESYAREHAPGLPPDHAPTVFNAASEDQWAPGHWVGDEVFLLENMHAAHSRIEGELPRLQPRAFVTQRSAEGERFLPVSMVCDTVFLFPRVMLGAIVFHGVLPVAEPDGRDVVHLIVGCEELGAPRSETHYQAALARRLDKENGSLADLSDSDLMPGRESGVVPNMDLGPIGQWLKSDMIAAENDWRGAERTRARRAAEVLAEGLDPAAFGLTTPIERVERPPVDDLDALAGYLTRMDSTMAEAERDAKRKSDEGAETRRQLLRAEGLAPDAQESPEPPGPPTFRAEGRLREEAEIAREAREAGAPDVELEARLASESYREELRELERMMKEGYRTSAHLLPTAAPMSEEATAMARLVVAMARESSEPLADRDFTGVDFRDLDLSGMSFERAFLEGADLRGANLSGANLRQAVLAKADLRGARLDGAQLQGVNLGGANLEGCSFERADLRGAVLMRASTTSASFREAELEGADVLEVHWRGADLRGCRFDRCTFLKADLTGADFSRASLVQTTFLECTLDDTVFDDANLHKASFVTAKGVRTSFARADAHEAVFVHGTQLSEAQFDEANLERACLRTTLLREARFHGSRMTMSDLSECDASNARFDRAVLKKALAMRVGLEGASLRGVNLEEAVLTQARIGGSDFTGAQLTRADLAGAVGDERTRFDEAVTAWAKFARRTERGANR